MRVAPKTCPPITVNIARKRVEVGKGGHALTLENGADRWAGHTNGRRAFEIRGPGENLTAPNRQGAGEARRKQLYPIAGGRRGGGPKVGSHGRKDAVVEFDRRAGGN